MKTEILKLLQSSTESVSGQEICNRFSVSRTAVWKVINQLKEEGYCIEAVQNKGYRIISAPDILTEAEIASRLKTDWAGSTLSCKEETDSTNTDCKKLAEQGSLHGLLCTANTQIAGRGRRGRTWESPKGTSISMTLLLRPEIKPDQAPQLTLVMALAITRAVSRLCSETCSIKWPNDILLNNKKICGILTEMSAEMDYVHYVVIGCGINVNQDYVPMELEQIATSIKMETGTRYQRSELIAEILQDFEQLYQQFLYSGDLSAFVEEYDNYLVNRGRMVRVLDPKEEFEGEALGISPNGELFVKTAAGETVKVYAGEVSVRGIYGYV